ncbi:hypothetical protein C8D87_103602 [Lentzea atacamensis]|uniref:AMP-binding enzyme C-terminal domain-containing protein n=1 Tax=Lentzea atacamensis TaxID=531938 RepID=A0ABX9EBI2_9PSEU|nr:hypothetical protein [Lentzea atacamensis]RAS67263.1 hypothetical protein C8D87_103602 [Lentzea atacamensis]
MRDGKPHGVLALGPRQVGTFGDREIEHASAIAARAALAVSVAERARLSREIAVHEERRRMAVRRTVHTGHGVRVDEVAVAPPGTLPRSSSGKLLRAWCRDAYTAGAPG